MPPRSFFVSGGVGDHQGCEWGLSGRVDGRKPAATASSSARRIILTPVNPRKPCRQLPWHTPSGSARSEAAEPARPLLPRAVYHVKRGVQGSGQTSGLQHQPAGFCRSDDHAQLGETGLSRDRRGVRASRIFLEPRWRFELALQLGDALGKSATGMTRAGWNFAKNFWWDRRTYPNSKWRPGMALARTVVVKVTIPSSRARRRGDLPLGPDPGGPVHSRAPVGGSAVESAARSQSLGRR